MPGKRKKGEGTVRLRKDGRWEGRMVIGYDEKNLPKTRNVLAKTKKECMEKLVKLREACHAGNIPATPHGPPSFGIWLDIWYRAYCQPALRPTTQKAYENGIYRHLIPALGAIPLEKLTTHDLQQFYAQLKADGRIQDRDRYGCGLSDRTVRNIHAICRAALDQAAAEHLILRNPAEGCRLPPKKAREMQVLSLEELQRFLIQAKSEGIYELFLLELTTGMRQGELLALQWKGLDFSTGKLRIDKQVQRIGGTLTISEPKTRAASRTIILPPAMLEVLAEYKKGIFSDLIFPSRIKPDQPIDPSYVRKRLQVILKRAGCRSLRFHDLRHTFATMSLENGMDVKTLSTIIGHVSVATTLDTYIHITDQMRRNAALNIDRGIAKAEAPPFPTGTEPVPKPKPFTPIPLPRRRPGTGCITQINNHLWEGRYSPRVNGKRMARNVYAGTMAECEEKLAALIREMKGEIARLRKQPEAPST